MRGVMGKRLWLSFLHANEENKERQKEMTVEAFWMLALESLGQVGYGFSLNPLWAVAF